jgi:hypothetical protein
MMDDLSYLADNIDPEYEQYGIFAAAAYEAVEWGDMFYSRVAIESSSCVNELMPFVAAAKTCFCAFVFEASCVRHVE